MKKENFVAFMSNSLKKNYESLGKGNFSDKQLYKFINRPINDLKQNPLYGTKIPKKLWPKEYLKKYKITNLWKYDLPNAWRLIYTLETDEIRIVSIVLEWFNHKIYERKFKY